MKLIYVAPHNFLVTSTSVPSTTSTTSLETTKRTTAFTSSTSKETLSSTINLNTSTTAEGRIKKHRGTEISA